MDFKCPYCLNIDTIPDMIVSVVNVTGDMAAVAVVAIYTKEIPKPGEGNYDLIAKGS